MTETTMAPTGTDTPQKPVEIETKDAYRTLLAEHDLVLLQFYTSGCGICASMEPVLGIVARTAPGVVATMNAGLVPDVPSQYNVRSVPTHVVIRDGEEVARFDDGFVGADALGDALEQHTA